MSVGAHKCNQHGCPGFILTETADYDYKKTLGKGSYVLEKPTCETCGKEFQMVISHVLIEVDEQNDLVDELTECCITEYERYKRAREALA